MRNCVSVSKSCLYLPILETYLLLKPDFAHFQRITHLSPNITKLFPQHIAKPDKAVYICTALKAMVA